MGVPSTSSDASDKPTLIIRHTGDQPKLEWPAGVTPFPVKFINQDEEDSLLIDYNGVRVYQCVKDEFHGEVQEWSEHWAATEFMTDYESEYAFDLRDLPNYPKHLVNKYKTMFPSPVGSVDLSIHNTRCLAYAIDKGWLTENGYQPPKKKASTQ